MSAIRMAKTAILAFAASRNPAVRAAIKAAPGMISEDRKMAAYALTKKAARKAGEIAAKVIPANRHF